MNIKKILFKPINVKKSHILVLASLVVIGIAVSAFQFMKFSQANPAAPNPGHTWSEIGDVLVSTMKTVVTRPVMATGAIAATTMSSLTSFNVGLFNVPQRITVNQLTYDIGTVTTAGTYKVCVYSEDGATKLIDVTSGTNAAGVRNVAVSSAVLNPGNYYIAMGCATTCSNTVYLFTTTSAAWINAGSVPSGKKIHEGTVTMTSGTCNSTLPTITDAISKTPVMRLDN